MQSSLSIVMCTYNGAAFVEAQVQSILAQTYPFEELVIVDDASTDQTYALLQELTTTDARIKLYQNAINIGYNANFEKAIRLSAGDYIAFADQDDIWEPLKIQLMSQVQLNPLDDVPSLVFSDLSLINTYGEHKGNSFWEMADLDPMRTTFNSLMFANVVTGCASLINHRMRDLLKEIPSDVMMHDHWIGLIAYGLGKVEIISQPLVRYRIHDDSVTEKQEADFFWKMKKQIHQIFGDSSGYLQKEIDQMLAFDRLFGDQLNPSRKKQLEAFLMLKNQSLLKKKIASYKKFSI